MEGIGEFAASGQHAENRRAARNRGLIAFENQCAGTLGHHKAVAVLRKRFGRRLRRIVLRGKRRQQRETHHRFLVD